MVVAVIPARGGSKRIIKKNIVDFAGKPLIAHSIEKARNANLFDRIIVSTDDPQIIEVALHYGAEVPFVRPADLSDDLTGTIAVTAHAIGKLNEASTRPPEAVCCIYATAPFLEVSDLRKGLAILQSADWQYVFSATQFTYPVYRGFLTSEGSGVEMLFPEHQTARSQDLPDVLHDAGQFYWGRAEAWLRQLSIFEHWSTVVRLPSWRVQDIDTMEDLERAQRLYKAMV